ncbi:MAG: substrate-binding domain-containing protein [Bacteroides xylanisolvens]
MRLTNYIALLLFVCALLACSEKSDKKYIIGVSQCSGDLWRNTVNEEMKREAEFHPNLQLEIKTAYDNTQQQITDIEHFVDIRVDILVVAPNESSALTPAIEKAFKANIPVILFDRKVNTDNYTAYIGADNFQLAQELGAYVANMLDYKGRIFIMRGWNGSTADDLRYKGFRDTIDKYPGIEIVAERRGDFTEEQSKIEMYNFLEDNIGIDLVFAMNDPMAYGVKKAYDSQNIKAPIIVGIDALAGVGGGIEAIEDGIINASSIYPTGGDKVIELASRILNKQAFNKENILYSTVVDKNNARILKLQHAQIKQQQEKFDKTSEMLNRSIARYALQKNLFFLSLIVIILVSSFLAYIIIAYRQKNKANIKLASQNEKITKQSTKLQKQKDELIELSEQLEQATNAKLMFFTNISHEFKTPLSLILAPVETLLTYKYNEDQSKLLNLIKRNSNRLLQLISEIIEFRSYENNRAKIYFSKDNLASFIEDLTSLFANYQKEKGVHLNIDIEGTSFSMLFDKEKIEKVYSNLLSNAFKHVDKKGKVDISLRKIIVDGKFHAELIVSNTGSFIPEEAREQIFNRFYIHHNEIGDTGIGLSLASMMIETHNGKIFVDKSDETGTSFKVIIPFDQDLTKNTHNESKYKIGSYSETKIEINGTNESTIVPTFVENCEKAFILIIEDSVDMRQYLKLLLQEEYNIIEASDGEEGIEKAIKYTPDLIISDILMPNRSGYEVGKVLRERVSTSHIPLIMLTACSLDEQKSLGFESGADAYIPKPFNAALLKVRIRKLIESRQKMRESFKTNLLKGYTKESLAQSEQSFIDKFIAYINDNISNPTLGVENIADHVGLSKSQLYRKLKSITDYSPNEFIKIIRLKLARQMLLQKSSPISDIAYAVGFSSPSYFTKCFREYYNESPSDVILNG